MLNPAPLVDAFAMTLRAIPDLAAAMTVTGADGNPDCRITAYHYRLGQEHRLAQEIYQMPAPSILFVWDGTLSGNFDGQTVWKHRFSLYFRMGNAVGLTDITEEGFRVLGGSGSTSSSKDEPWLRSSSPDQGTALPWNPCTLPGSQGCWLVD